MLLLYLHFNKKEAPHQLPRGGEKSHPDGDERNLERQVNHLVKVDNR